MFFRSLYPSPLTQFFKDPKEAEKTTEPQEEVVEDEEDLVRPCDESCQWVLVSWNKRRKSQMDSPHFINLFKTEMYFKFIDIAFREYLSVKTGARISDQKDKELHLRVFQRTKITVRL